jgi:hypothetical protein
MSDEKLTIWEPVGLVGGIAVTFGNLVVAVNYGNSEPLASHIALLNAVLVFFLLLVLFPDINPRTEVSKP